MHIDVPDDFFDHTFAPPLAAAGYKVGMFGTSFHLLLACRFVFPAGGCLFLLAKLTKEEKKPPVGRVRTFLSLSLAPLDVYTHACEPLMLKHTRENMCKRASL